MSVYIMYKDLEVQSDVIYKQTKYLSSVNRGQPAFLLCL